MVLSCEISEIKCILSNRNSKTNTRYVEMLDENTNFCPRLFLNNMNLQAQYSKDMVDYVVIDGNDTAAYQAIEKDLLGKIFECRESLFKNAANISYETLESIYKGCIENDAIKLKLSQKATIQQFGRAKILLKGFNVYSRYFEADFVIESLEDKLSNLKEYFDGESDSDMPSKNEIQESDDAYKSTGCDEADEGNAADGQDAHDDELELGPDVVEVSLDEHNLEHLDVELCDDSDEENYEYNDDSKKEELESELQGYIDKFKKIRTLIDEANATAPTL